MNNKTELVFIMDKSGSMAGLESDTVGGFNSMIKKQKGLEGECLVSTVFFNQESEVIHDRVPVEKINELTEDEYRVSGSTALIDALGDSIHHISNIHKYARKEDVPEHTMFVITTDGCENASSRYTADQVRKSVEEKKELGWEFIFVAANIDAVETAKHYGIDKDRAVNYIHDPRGTETVFNGVSRAVTGLRNKACVDECWAKEINEDFGKRSN